MLRRCHRGVLSPEIVAPGTSLPRSAKVAAIVLVNVLLLLVIESGLRVLATVRQDLSSPKEAPEPGWFSYSPTLGWTRRPGYRGQAAGPRAFDESGYLTVDSPQVADTTHRHKRVLFIGDSNTMGYQVPAESTFAEVAERRLPGVDAINLGVIGYSSYQGRLVLESSLSRLKPDAIVVSFNYNDRRSVGSAADADGAQHFRRVAAAGSARSPHLAGWLARSYTAQALRSVLRRVGLIATPAAVTPVRLDSLPLRVGEAAYRDNLRRIATLADSSGVPVIFLILGDNPVQTYNLRQGLARLDAGDSKLARVYLAFASRQGSGAFALLARRHLARAYALSGDSAQAARTLWMQPLPSILLGRDPMRLDTEYHEIMRAVAAESRADLVDGAAVLAAHPEDFIDGVHFDADGHRLIGEVVASRLARILATHPSR